jgi:hypothetical protein
MGPLHSRGKKKLKVRVLDNLDLPFSFLYSKHGKLRESGLDWGKWLDDVAARKMGRMTARAARNRKAREEGCH